MFRTIKITNQLTIRDFLHLPFQTFGLTGLKLFAWDVDDEMTRREKITFAFALFNLTFNFCSKAAFVVFEEFEDTLQLTALTVYLGFATNGICKLASVWLGRKTLHAVICEMDEMFPMTIQQRKDYRLRQYYDYGMRYMRFLLISHCFVALMFILFPITQSVVEYFAGWREDGAFVYRFPYIMTYFFDEYRPVAFTLVYASQFLGGCAVSCFFVGSDLVLVATVHLLNMQFAYLSNRIRNFKTQGPQADMHELKEVVYYHSRILSLADRINEVFSVSIFLNYLISIMVICLIGFQVVAGSGFLDLLKFVAFLCSSLTHIFFICHFGTNLMTSSQDIAEALGGHAWHSTDIRYQRMMPLIIARAQRPAHLTAYKFFIISMESFTSLMTTSYQFFTLIKSRYEEANEMN